MIIPTPIVVQECSSALDCAWDFVAQKKLPVWGSVFAHSQTQGRGQTRRFWHSPTGNIYAALRLPAEGPFLGTAAAVACSALILTVLETWGCAVKLKWPNDLVSVDTTKNKNACKVGGILLEERQGILMAGIGINTTQAPDAHYLRPEHALPAGILPLSTVSKLLMQAKKTEIIYETDTVVSSIHSAESLWTHLVRQMYFCYTEKFPTHFAWKTQAEHFLLWQGQWVEVDDGHRKLGGIVSNLGAQGELILAFKDQYYEILSGSIRLATGAKLTVR